jgi:hypothetical protein
MTQIKILKSNDLLNFASKRRYRRPLLIRASSSHVARVYVITVTDVCNKAGESVFGTIRMVDNRRYAN